jgi:hypothetical protein
LRSCVPTWPKLEEKVKNWIIRVDHRKDGIVDSTKVIVIEVRRLAIEMSIIDFATSWCERSLGRYGLCMRIKTTIAQKRIE